MQSKARYLQAFGFNVFESRAKMLKLFKQSLMISSEKQNSNFWMLLLTISALMWKSTERRFCSEKRTLTAPCWIERNSSAWVDNFAEAAAAFVVTLSLDYAVARASKALQADFTRKEAKRRESMEMNEPFVPSERSIREIIRQEIYRMHAKFATSWQQSPKKGLFPGQSLQAEE